MKDHPNSTYASFNITAICPLKKRRLDDFAKKKFMKFSATKDSVFLYFVLVTEIVANFNNK